MKPFVIIPAFNEEKTIGKVVKSALQYVPNVLVADDGSSDNTSLIAKKAGAEVIQSSNNLGYDGILEMGFQSAVNKGATILISMDADGQHPPEVIKDMIRLVQINDFDIVVGIRKELPRLSEKIFAFFTNIKFSINDITCGMKCYKASLYKKYRFKKDFNSIGTYLTLISLKKKYYVEKVYINTKSREDISRYGININSELKIIYSILRSIPFLL